MDDIFNSAFDPAAWDLFYRHIEEGGHATRGELSFLKSFIESEKYRLLLDKIVAGQPFPLARMISINKQGTAKKRVVFSFGRDEAVLLRFFGFGLHKYDCCWGQNLYSFVLGRSVKNAIDFFKRCHGLDKKYALKLDIHDYFNSVNVPIILAELQPFLSDEPTLYRLLADILGQPLVVGPGSPVAVKKGIMAGSPLAPFLADFYLNRLDHYFADNHVIYARYADDIILFAGTQAQLDQYYQYILQFLAGRGLELNPRKVLWKKPGEYWEFLGFAFENGQVDISHSALAKIKAKMHRKMRALKRWRLRKNTTPEQAVRAYIRYFNRKFYDNSQNDELTWARWYFPSITTAKSLRLIDNYMQQCIRYLANDTHTKRAYNFRYAQMKANGYRPLVGEFYKKESGDV